MGYHLDMDFGWNSHTAYIHNIYIYIHAHISNSMMRWVCLNMAYTQIFTSSNYQVDRYCRVRQGTGPTILGRYAQFHLCLVESR